MSQINLCRFGDWILSKASENMTFGSSFHRCCDWLRVFFFFFYLDVTTVNMTILEMEPTPFIAARTLRLTKISDFSDICDILPYYYHASCKASSFRTTQQQHTLEEWWKNHHFVSPFAYEELKHHLPCWILL